MSLNPKNIIFFDLREIRDDKLTNKKSKQLFHQTINKAIYLSH
ncbi:MAG TPA: hypothetical protein ACHBX0_04145 [Arsenophonus sp.]